MSLIGDDIMFFGKKLKELRLKAGYGLRTFAETLPILPSDLSDIENGWKAPPSPSEKFYDTPFIDRILRVLSKGHCPIPLDQEEKNSLKELYSKPFEVQEMSETIFPAPWASKVDGTKLSTVELKELTETMQNRAKEHNKKQENIKDCYIICKCKQS
jgi:transcriptional regulator with XRE-family HTH domain